MKAKRAGKRQGLLIAALWALAVAAALQAVGSAYQVPQLNWLGEAMDVPPHLSPLFAAAALGIVGLGAVWLYVRGLNPYAARRPMAQVTATLLAPCALATALLVAFDQGQGGGPTLLTWAGAPAVLLGPPLAVLLVERIVHAICEQLCVTAQERDWRRLGIRASLVCLRLKPDDRRMQARCGLLMTSEDEYASAIGFLEKLGPVREGEGQSRLRAMERCYRALGRQDLAVGCLEALLHINPTSRGLANRLLDDYLALERDEEALQLLETLQLKDSLTRLQLRQRLNMRMGNFDQAFELIKKITAYEDETHDLSIRLDRQLLEQDPRRVEAWAHLGGLLLEADSGQHRAEGARLLEDVVARQPERMELRRRLIAFYLETDQQTRTEAHLQALVKSGETDGAVYLTYAQLLQRLERGDEAQGVLESMTERLPEDWRGHVRLARMRLGRNDVEKARASIQRAESCMNEEGAAWVEQLRNDIARVQRERKIESIREDLQRDSMGVETHLKLIDELIRSEKIAEAVQNCEALLHEHPAALAALQERLEAGIRQTTMNFRLCDYLADLYFKQERYDDLLRLFREMAEKSLEPNRLMREGCERILERSPNHVGARQELAFRRRMENDWAGVIDALTPLLSGEDQSEENGAGALPVEDRALWVEAMYRQGRLEEAARVGQGLVDALAGESGFMLLMIDILRAMEDHAGAYRIYEKASRAMPDDTRLQRLARRIDYDRKVQRLEQLGARAPESLSAEEHYEKAELHREFSQLEQAIVHYQRASGDDALALAALGNMAVAMCERGMYDMAFETLEPIELTREIDATTPALKEMFYKVAQAMEKHKRFDKAVEIYKRIFRVDAAFADVVGRLQRLA
jgi:pentatricopeptide repeat protein